MNILTYNGIIKSGCGTVGACSDVVVGTSKETDRQRDEWQHIIDDRLIEWGRNPGQFDDPETIEPTPAAVKAAHSYARHFRDKRGGFPVPDWVVPSGDGGITFQWGEHGGDIQSLEIDEGGRANFIEMHSSRVTLREPVDAVE